MRVLETTLRTAMYACFGFGMSYNVVLLLWGRLSLKFLSQQRPSVRQAPMSHVRADGLLPGVSMVVPAFNEELLIVDAVRSLFEQDYPDIEVIVVSDGSTDATVQQLVDAFDMNRMLGPVVHGPIPTKPIRAVYRSKSEPRIVVVDKDPSGSKADGSNCAINYASKAWCAVMDADELVDRQAVLKCMTAAMSTPGNVVGVGVTLLPTNHCEVHNWQVTKAISSTNAWVGFQTIEYLGAFLLSRPGMSLVGALPIVSGGFGVFRRDALERVGGYTHGSLGEDLDIVVRLHRMFLEAGEVYRIIQVPEAVVWTQFPDSYAVLKRQRVRWHRGLRQVIVAHGCTVGRRRYSMFGTRGMAHLFVFEWLGVMVEGLGYVLTVVLVALGMIRPLAIIPIFCAAQAFGTCVTVMSVRTCARALNVYRGKRNMARLLMWAVLSQFGYHQLSVWWRLRSLFKGGTGWGVMPRHAFGTAAQTPAPATTQTGAASASSSTASAA